MLENEIKYFYYGTINPELGRSKEIDPKHKNTKKFEFGNGFYLTEYKNVAIDYVRNGLLERHLENTDIEAGEGVDKLLDGSVYSNGYIHRYEVKKEDIDKEQMRYCEDVNSYKEVLKDTIKGYESNDSYAPDYEYTYGLICGRYWDQNVNKVTLDDNFIENCIDNMMYVLDDDKNEVEAKQLCLHQNLNILFNHECTTVNADTGIDSVDASSVSA